SIEQGLRLALAAQMDQQAADAYACLQDCYAGVQRFEEAQRYHRAGIAFCERHGLRAAARSLQGAHAEPLLLLASWDEAADICTELLAIPDPSPANQLCPMQILGTIRGRRGEPGDAELLDRGAALAAGIVSPKWLARVRAVRAELLWASGQPDLARQEATQAY